MSAKGKVLFVTGAASGIGKAIAEIWLQQGGKSFLVDLNETALSSTCKEFGEKYGSQNVGSAQLDVTDASEFEATFKQAVTQFGSVDVMVNNAGIFNEYQWQLMIDINLKAMITGTNVAAEHMRKDKGGKGGRIINVGSEVSLYPGPVTPVYCATKHAIRAYTSSMAKQPHLKGQAIEYALLCPGPVETNIFGEHPSTKIPLFKMVEGHMATLTYCPPSDIAEAFLELTQLKEMNDAILLVYGKDRTYRKMENVNLGTTYPPKP